jgi:hypothetical protein
VACVGLASLPSRARWRGTANVEFAGDGDDAVSNSMTDMMQTLSRENVRVKTESNREGLGKPRVKEARGAFS